MSKTLIKEVLCSIYRNNAQSFYATRKNRQRSGILILIASILWLVEMGIKKVDTHWYKSVWKPVWNSVGNFIKLIGIYFFTILYCTLVWQLYKTSWRYKIHQMFHIFQLIFLLLVWNTGCNKHHLARYLKSLSMLLKYSFDTWVLCTRHQYILHIKSVQSRIIFWFNIELFKAPQWTGLTQVFIIFWQLMLDVKNANFYITDVISFFCGTDMPTTW